MRFFSLEPGPEEYTVIPVKTKMLRTVAIGLLVTKWRCCEFWLAARSEEGEYPVRSLAGETKQPRKRRVARRVAMKMGRRQPLLLSHVSIHSTRCRLLMASVECPEQATVIEPG
jgi:hypothetical protein